MGIPVHQEFPVLGALQFACFFGFVFFHSFPVDEWGVSHT